MKLFSNFYKSAWLCPMAGAVALLMALAPAPAAAVPLLWTLNDVTFNGGGMATGSFQYDADTGAYSDVAVTTSGGGTTNTSFDKVVALGPGYLRLLNEADGPDYSGDPTLQFTFLEVLTNAGGEIGLELNSFSSGRAGCVNAGCFILTGIVDGQFESGSVIGAPVVQVPEPATLATLAFGVFGLGFLGRRKARRL